jgi:hypothetical protein
MPETIRAATSALPWTSPTQRPTPHFVQDQLGHHDPKFTASAHGHLIPGDRRGEDDFLDGLGELAKANALADV